VIAAPSEITDADVERLRAHGYSNEQTAEVVGIVSLMLLGCVGAFPQGRHGEPRAWPCG
jgi:hypothetical protein